MIGSLTLVQREAFCVELLDGSSGFTGKQENVPILIPHDGGSGWQRHSTMGAAMGREDTGRRTHAENSSQFDSFVVAARVGGGFPQDGLRSRANATFATVLDQPAVTA